jgi:uncharacterized iron-regulated membrane protein
MLSFNFFRRFFYEIHLWLGILSGIVVFWVCLSGSILAFREEINQFVNSGKYYVSVPANEQRMPIDELIGKVESTNPDMKVISLTIPEKKNRTIVVWLDDPMPVGERAVVHHAEDWYVNPYTGAIVAKHEDDISLDHFFESMIGLHQDMGISYQIGRVGDHQISLGELIVDAATLIFVVIILSGFVLWLPRTWKSFIKWRAWQPGFKIRFRKGFWCFIHDIHNTVGFYCLIPLLILALTGLCWSFIWYQNAANYLLGEQVNDRKRIQRFEKIVPVDENAKPLAIGEMIEHLNKLIPGSGEITLAIPNDRESAMTIEKGKTGFFALSIKDRTSWDRFRGTVIPIEHYGKTVEIERFTEKPIGTQIALAIRALHFGEITGLSSKIVFFIACVFGMTFPITGIALWGRKLVAYYRKRKTAKNKNIQ